MRKTLRLFAAFALIAAFASPLFFSSGCGGKKKKNNTPKPTAPDAMAKWDSIRGMGMEGKQLCEAGMKMYQTASTDDERKKAQEMMGRGIDMVNEACDKGADLLEIARKKNPGYNYGGYDDEMTKWGQAMWQAKKFVTLDSMD